MWLRRTHLLQHLPDGVRQGEVPRPHQGPDAGAPRGLSRPCSPGCGSQAEPFAGCCRKWSVNRPKNTCKCFYIPAGKTVSKGSGLSPDCFRCKCPRRLNPQVSGVSPPSLVRHRRKDLPQSLHGPLCQAPVSHPNVRSDHQSCRDLCSSCKPQTRFLTNLRLLFSNSQTTRRVRSSLPAASRPVNVQSGCSGRCVA